MFSSAFLQGVLFGLGLSILVGPILFILLQVSLERGYKCGLLVGLGIWLSDIAYIITAYLLIRGLGIDLMDPDLRFYFSMIGGTVLIAVGISMFMKKATEPQQQRVWSGRSLFYFLSVGFSTNTFNPFTAFFWFTVTAANIAERGTGGSAFLFILGIMLTLVVTDSGKVFAAHILRRYLSPVTVARVRKVAAGVIMAFGVWLILTGIG